MREDLPGAYPAPPARTAVLGQLSVGSRWTIAAMLAAAGAVSFILGRSTADDDHGFGQDRFGPGMQGGGFSGGAPGSMPPDFDTGGEPGMPPVGPGLDGTSPEFPGEQGDVEVTAA